MSRGIGGHSSPFRGASDEWLTPPALIKVLGPFDLDPCAPIKRPWPTATTHLTIEDDGLAADWGKSFVWMNPPYGPQTAWWLKKLSEHRRGLALIFARTETEMFHRWGWERADAMLFLRGRIHFHRVTGDRAAHNSGGPSVLLAYGNEACRRLKDCRIKGRFIPLRSPRLL